MQAQAVEQLRFISRQLGCQPCHFTDLGVAVVICCGGLGHGLENGHALQDHAHFFQRRGSVQAVLAQGLNSLNHRLAIAYGQRVNQAKHIGAVHAAEHLPHRGFRQLARTKGNGLVGQAQGVAHGAPRAPGQQAQGLGVCRNVFGVEHLLQVFADGFGRHRAQVELQTAREHGDGHFLRVRGGQHKFEVFGRLFQRFQHGVKRRVGEHVHLVNHEDLETPLHWLVNSLLQQSLHLVHATVGGGIKLGVIYKPTGINVGTGLADAAGRCRDAALTVRTLAVKRLGQNARHRGLAHPTRTGKQVGMVQALGGQGIGQGLHHVVLPHHFGEVTGTVLAGEHEVRHAAILRGWLGRYF